MHKFYILFIILLFTGIARAQELSDKDIDDGAYILASAGCINCHDIGGHNATSKMIPIATSVIPEPLFEQILRQGRNFGGNKMLAIMPFEHYALMTDEDVHKLYAYYTAVRNPNAKVTSTPLPAGNRFKPDPQKSDEYNRGAYLVNAIGFCGACHAPDGGMTLSGGTMGKKWDIFTTDGSLLHGQNWDAYNISADSTAGIGAWDTEEIVTFLTAGTVDTKGPAGGLMGRLIVQNMTRFMDQSDVQAIALYLKTAQPLKGKDSKARYQYGSSIKPEDMMALKSEGMEQLDTHKELSGAALYNGWCATCHGWEGMGSTVNAPSPLIHNSTVGASSPNNLILTVLQGISRRQGREDIFMPSFASTLTDKEIVILVNFITKQFGNPTVTTTEKAVKFLR